jgi:hypothetical protein
MGRDPSEESFEVVYEHGRSKISKRCTVPVRNDLYIFYILFTYLFFYIIRCYPQQWLNISLFLIY